MPKTYKTEPTTIEEAKATIAEIILDLAGLETKITKTEGERDKKTQEFRDLNARYNADIKKAKAGNPHGSSLPPSAEILALRQQVKDLQTENTNYSQAAQVIQNTIDTLKGQKISLENKVSELEGKLSQGQKETTENNNPDELNKYVGYGLVGFGVLIIGLLITWIIRKIFSI